MKKLSAILFVTLAIALSSLNSCSKDDAKPVNPLIGSWQMSESESYTDPSTGDIYEYVYSVTITFNENLSGTVKTLTTVTGQDPENEESTFTYTHSGNKLTVLDSDNTTINMTFTISGKTLTLDEDGDTMVLTKV